MVLVLFMWQIDILIKLLHGNISKVTIKKKKVEDITSKQQKEKNMKTNKNTQSVPKKARVQIKHIKICDSTQSKMVIKHFKYTKNHNNRVIQQV